MDNTTLAAALALTRNIPGSAANRAETAAAAAEAAAGAAEAYAWGVSVSGTTLEFRVPTHEEGE